MQHSQNFKGNAFSQYGLRLCRYKALTVIANGCYRWLASKLKGFDKAKPKELYRKFVETGGRVDIGPDRLHVQFDRRAHNPILREAALDQAYPPIPWLPQRRLVFSYS